jgi:prevent-host-death family protein
METGVRELKANLSRFLADVRRGEVVTVTDRGRPIALLIPAGEQEVPAKLAELIADGTIQWSGRDAVLKRPRARLKGLGETISDIVIANRG